MSPIEFSLKRRWDIPFNGVCAALPAHNTLVSGLITFPFRIIKVAVHYGQNHIQNVRHYVMTSGNTTTSTTDVPPDDNIFSQMSPSPYLQGDDSIREYETSWPEDKGRKHIKIHVQNLNAYAVIINAVVTIEEL